MLILACWVHELGGTVWCYTGYEGTDITRKDVRKIFADYDIRKVSPYFETLLNDFWMMLRRDEYEKSKIFPR